MSHKHLYNPKKWFVQAAGQIVSTNNTLVLKWNGFYFKYQYLIFSSSSKSESVQSVHFSTSTSLRLPRITGQTAKSIRVGMGALQAVASHSKLRHGLHFEQKEGCLSWSFRHPRYAWCLMADRLTQNPQALQGPHHAQTLFPGRTFGSSCCKSKQKGYTAFHYLPN